MIARTTVQHVKQDKIANIDIMNIIRDYHEKLEKVIGDNQYASTESEFERFVNEDVSYPREEAVEGLRERGHKEPYQGYDLPDIDEFSMDTNDCDNKEIFDSYLGSENLLPDQDLNKTMEKVIKLVKGNACNPVGTRHNNPMLDTSEYNVEISDVSSQELTANIFAELMFAQVYSEVHHYQLLQELTDHMKDRSAIPISDGMVRSHNDNMVPKKTTQVWDLLADWKDGSSSCISLKYLKAFNPVDIAKYAAGKRLDAEPAFKWWMRDVLRLRNIIIAKVKDRYWRKAHRFGI